MIYLEVDMFLKICFLIWLVIEVFLVRKEIESGRGSIG